MLLCSLSPNCCFFFITVKTLREVDWWLPWTWIWSLPNQPVWLPTLGALTVATTFETGKMQRRRNKKGIPLEIRVIYKKIIIKLNHLVFFMFSTTSIIPYNNSKENLASKDKTLIFCLLSFSLGFSLREILTWLFCNQLGIFTKCNAELLFDQETAAGKQWNICVPQLDVNRKVQKIRIATSINIPYVAHDNSSFLSIKQEFQNKSCKLKITERKIKQRQMEISYLDQVGLLCFLSKLVQTASSLLHETALFAEDDFSLRVSIHRLRTCSVLQIVSHPVKCCWLFWAPKAHSDTDVL